MKRLRRNLLFLFTAMVQFLHVACEQRMASTEIGNPTEKARVVGLATDTAGNPIPFARVRLRPKEYLSPLGRDTGVRAGWHTFTDSSGAFILDGLAKGSFRIDVNDGEGLGAVRDCRIDSVGQRIDLDSVRLDRVGSLAGRIAGISGGSILIRVYGMEISTRPDSLSGFFRINNIPSGEYDLDISSMVEETAPRRVMEAKVSPAAATTLEDLFLKADITRWRHTSVVQEAPLPIRADTASMPILLRLGNANFPFGAAESDGADFRLVSEAGAAYPHEIEHWDPTRGEAVVWVSRLGVSPFPGDLRMLWGNPQATFPVPIRPVFDTAEGYAAVWHFGNVPNTKAPRFQDATRREDLLSMQAPPPVAVVTPWGEGLEFDGSQYLATQAAQEGPRYLTLSLWFKTASKTGGRLIGFGSNRTGASVHYDRHIWMDDGGRIHFGVYQNSPKTAISTLSSASPFNDDAWHQVSATVSSAGQELYVDGKPVAKDATPIEPAAYAGYWRIGNDNLDGVWSPKPSTYFFQGRIDEIRILRHALDSARIAREYENQQPATQWIVLPRK